MRILIVLALLPLAAIAAAVVATSSNAGLIVAIAGLVLYYVALSWLAWRRRALLAAWMQRQRGRRSISATGPQRVVSAPSREASLTLADIRASTKLSRSHYGLRILASRATGGLGSLEELRAIAAMHLDDPHNPEVQLLWPAMSETSALALVDALVSLREHTMDVPLAISILERLSPKAGADNHRLDESRQLRLPWLLLERGDHERALRAMTGCEIHDMLADQVRADILNPFISGNQGRLDDARIKRWLFAANRVMTHGDLEPISLIDSPELLPFDRLHSAARNAAITHPGDPVVSIVMTTFRPGREAISAVRSVLSQSWTLWELLVIDDASGAEFAAILDEIEAMDARITVVRRADNAGTYVCRNVALDIAQGELVTVLDADDWMHPRRIEFQVLDLMSHPDQLANVTNTLRVTQNLGFLHDRGPGVKLCEPAMMFRRRQLIDRVGYYHEARKGADSELRWRINAIQGFPVSHLTSLPPLTLQRFDTGSLSGGDFVRGWIHPARISYRSAWWEWHRHNRHNPSALRLVPGAQAPFPTPPHMSGRPRADSELERDVVLIVDASDRGSLVKRHKTVLQLTSELQSLGLNVGIMHVWTMGEIPGGHLTYSPLLQASINAGRVVEVFADDEVKARLAIALSDAEVSVLGSLPSAWKHAELAVVSGQSPAPVSVAGPPVRRLTHEEVLRTARSL